MKHPMITIYLDSGFMEIFNTDSGMVDRTEHD